MDTFTRNLTAARDAFRTGDKSTALQHAATARAAMNRPQRDRYCLVMLDLTIIRSNRKGAALAADILADMSAAR